MQSHVRAKFVKTVGFSIRPFCVKRKTSLHFGGGEDAEMYTVYHSIVSTLRIQE